MFDTAQRFLLVLRCLRQYKQPIWTLLGEYKQLQEYSGAVIEAYDKGSVGVKDAQFALVKLLRLKAFKDFVQVTESKADDNALKRVQELVESTTIFRIAWLILNGEWKIGVRQSRWDSFVKSIKNILPFVDRKKAVMQLASYTDLENELTEQDEQDVIEVVDVLNMVVSVIPPLTKIINKMDNEINK